MNFEKFKLQIKQADNDSLITSLIEHSKKADTDINYYEAVKLLKTELLERLNGDNLSEPQKQWREELTDVEFSKVFSLYESGTSISKIQKQLGDENLSQKAIRLAIASKYGEFKNCVRCEEMTQHIAFEINGTTSCVVCGNISM